MPNIKMLIVLMIATFGLNSVTAGFISLRLSGAFEHSFRISYDRNGKYSTQSSGRRDNGNERIEIPEEAVNIELTVYLEYQFTGGKEAIFTQFFSSSVEKCFVVDDWDWIEESCQKVATNGAYSISVNRYIYLFKIIFHLTYEYKGSNFTEITTYHHPVYSENKTAQIPDGATNIRFTIQKNTETDFQAKTKNPIILTKFYPSPVKKCFGIYCYYREARGLWFEKPCKKLPTENGNFISVNETGGSELNMKITYEYEDSNFTEFFRNAVDGENELKGTIQIPDKASNINVTVYKYKKSYLSPKRVFTKLYPSPVKKCYEVNTDFGINDLWFEKSCHKLPAKNGYSIVVDQTGNYSALFHVTFTYNGSNLTEASGVLKKTYNPRQTVEIPDEATNIHLVIHKYRGDNETNEIMFSEFFSNPVKKCFQLSDSSLLSCQ